MDEKDKGLDWLCKIYLDLTDGDKDIIIRLAEGLVSSQKIIKKEKLKLTDKNENTELKTE